MTENKADFFHLCISYMSMVSYVYKSYVSLETIQRVFFSIRTTLLEAIIVPQV